MGLAFKIETPVETRDAEVVSYPDRYVDPRGELMFGRVMGILENLSCEAVPF